MQSVSTDSQGRYSFSGVSGSVFVEAVVDDFHTRAVPGGYDCPAGSGCSHVGPWPYAPALGKDEDRVAESIVLNPAGAVVFHVVRADTGEPEPAVPQGSRSPEESRVNEPDLAHDAYSSDIAINHIRVYPGVGGYWGTEIYSAADNTLLGACADDTSIDLYARAGALPTNACANHDVEVYVGIRRELTIHLAPGAYIYGHLSESATGGPAVGAEMTLFHANDHRAVIEFSVGDSGNYALGPLLPDQYDLLFSDPVYNDQYHAQYYPDTPCSPTDCDISQLDPVVISNTGQSIRLQDVSLVPRQWIRGRVIDAVTGEPIKNVAMSLMSTLSVFGSRSWGLEQETRTDANGDYIFVGVSPKGFTVRALDYLNHHIGILKPAVSCEPDNSFCQDAPIVVDGDGNWIAPYTLQLDVPIEDADFSIDSGATASGHVYNRSTAKPLSNVTVDVRNDQGGIKVHTDASGHFQTPGFTVATLTATATNQTAAQLYQDIDCPSPYQCDITTGTAIVVGSGQQVTGIDFSLPPDADTLFSSGFDLL